MSNIREFDADIVFGSFEKISVAGTKKLFQYPKLFFFNEDDFANYAYRKYAGIQASVCNYLVKTSVLRDNNFRFIDTNYFNRRREK